MNDYKFLVEWEDPKTEVYIVGALIKEDDIYYFKYASMEQLKKAIDNGFKCVPTFWNTDKIYASKKMFDFFALRIAKNSDKSEDLLFEEDNGKIFTDHFSMRRA